MDDSRLTKKFEPNDGDDEYMRTCALSHSHAHTVAHMRAFATMLAHTRVPAHTCAHMHVGAPGGLRQVLLLPCAEDPRRVLADARLHLSLPRQLQRPNLPVGSRPPTPPASLRPPLVSIRRAVLPLGVRRTGPTNQAPPAVLADCAVERMWLGLARHHIVRAACCFVTAGCTKWSDSSQR